jgi:two-component system sensor histidine kinase UhpB
MTILLRVLIVEDSEEDALLMVRELGRAGYEPIMERVETAEAMSDALVDSTWDIVLADYNMPSFNAPAALALLQLRKIDLPFIIVSGAIGEETAVEAMKVGAHDYLMKDNLARLGPAVERELREAKERKARRHAEAEIRRRNRELAALNAVAEVVSESLDLDRVLDQALDKTLELTSLGLGAIWLLDDSSGELPLVAHRGLDEEALIRAAEDARIAFDLGPRHGKPLLNPIREPKREDDAAADPNAPVWVVALPLIARARALGMLMLGDLEERELRPDELSLLMGIAGLIGTAAENARLFHQVRQGRDRLQLLSRRLVEAQEVERQHLARELHDEVGQVLTGLKLSLEISKRLPADEASSSLDKAEELVNDLIARVRAMSLDLRPAMLDDLGLLPALLWHFERYQAQTEIQVAFDHGGLERRFNEGIETAAYRIVQEALTNVARYAEVSEVAVQIWAEENKLNVVIEDLGIGFEPEAALAAGDSSGLVGMHERANLLGGHLTVASTLGSGTQLRAELPLDQRLERRSKPR